MGYILRLLHRASDHINVCTNPDESPVPTGVQWQPVCKFWVCTSREPVERLLSVHVETLTLHGSIRQHGCGSPSNFHSTSNRSAPEFSNVRPHTRTHTHTLHPFIPSSTAYQTCRPGYVAAAASHSSCYSLSTPRLHPLYSRHDPPPRARSHHGHAAAAAVAGPSRRRRRRKR